MLMQSITRHNVSMTRNLDLDLIRTFVAVVDSGSMTVAANLLHMTQGAVSQQVKRLEDVLDCLLFVRKTRKLELSHQGEQFLVKARQLLRLNDEIWADMTGQLLRGRLRVGVPYDLVTPLAPALKAFAEAYPHVEISLVCAASPELNEAVNSGRVDVSLVEYVGSEAEGEVIRVEPLVWVKGRGSDAWQKRPLPLSMVDERCAFRPVVLGALANEGIAWRTVFESGKSRPIGGTQDSPERSHAPAEFGQNEQRGYPLAVSDLRRRTTVRPIATPCCRCRRKPCSHCGRRLDVQPVQPRLFVPADLVA
ncbi:transcriptional regulator, LysR family [Paraburkholderia phenazinium]|jgi:DNA-binding transcriptional LysR family regulator|uniref:Transcriptional regulator, LysR family n=2 Tax=Paraburkholderia phenazinium TaxID=60549 RepID=A0A1N6HLH8_9BURK|nr:transcriptional regulator, LysR family [Paraburkholderia phenazinium]